MAVQISTSAQESSLHQDEPCRQLPGLSLRRPSDLDYFSFDPNSDVVACSSRTLDCAETF